MSVLTRVEKKSWKGITFLTLVTVVLNIGAVAMVYPFILMVSGSLRSPMDQANRSIVPRYCYDEVQLGRKFVEAKYDYRLGAANLYRHRTDLAFDAVTIAEPVVGQRVEDLQAFVAEVELPDHWLVVGGTFGTRRTFGFNQRRFIAQLQQRYEHDIDAMATDLGVALNNWQQVRQRIPDWTSPRYNYDPSPYFDTYFQLVRARPLAERAFSPITSRFLELMVFPEYGKVESGTDADRERFRRFREDYGLSIDAYRDFALPRRYPAQAPRVFREAWATFVYELLNYSFVRCDASDAQYQDFLREAYDGDLDLLNRNWMLQDNPIESFATLSLPSDTESIAAGERRDFGRFILDQPVESLYLVGPEYAWRDWLRGRYDSLQELNIAHQAGYVALDAVPIPIAHAEQKYVLENPSALRFDFATTNYRDVIDEILLQGRPLVNTIIYVVLSVGLSLLLMPMAAYGLSRFNPPGVWRIVLILMATMAFPPMVGMIPQFLILRTFGLINTFVALLLPTIVNGYLIFLLKGFFDSLPKHLYEAALIDGASELRMFYSITLSLSKPILAVVALGAFNGAWASFMYPLLVAPAEEMQVLAVWLYEFQQQATQPAVFASILITSIPTLIVFLITQRTIMRGIAVPAEK